jgi:hypothetical protein
MAELRRLLETGQHVPGSRVMVDEERFIQALDGIRSAYVAELELARHTTRHQTEVLAAAHAGAGRLLAEAQRSTEAMLTDVGVRAAAEERAEDILERTSRSAAETEEGAWQYAMDTLVKMESSLRPVRDAVDAARRALGLQE